MPIIFVPEWENNEKFEDKLNRLLNLIDQESREGKISLLGISAGGSLVINAYLQRKSKIHRIVTVCSQLRQSHMVKNTTLSKSKAFKESVLKAENKIKALDETEKKQILNVRSLLKDELVPKDTSVIKGTKKIEIPTEAHILTIVMALTLLSSNIIRFIKSNQ